MRVAFNPCYILHQRPYRETSLILDVFSREHGKLSLVARGVKRGNGRQRALMQTNQKLNISWSQRGEMGTLSAIEADGMNLNLAGGKLIAAYYMNELLMRLLHRHEPHPQLFDTYNASLAELALDTSEQVVLRLFEKHLLESLGYGLLLDHDASSGEPVDAGKTYVYDPDAGPSISFSDGQGQMRVSGATLMALARNDLRDEIHLLEARRLTRHVLRAHLGDRPLASRELFRAYLRNRQANR